MSLEINWGRYPNHPNYPNYLDNLNDEIVKNLQDNINSIPRISLNNETPYNLTKRLYPDLIKKLDCKYIKPDDVSLSKDDILLINEK